MKYKILLIVIITSLFSCSEDNKSSYVDKESKVLDSIYASHSPQIEQLLNNVNSLNLEDLLASKFELIDSTNTEELVTKRRALLKIKPFIKTNLNLTLSNTVVVNNSANWLSLYGINDEVISKLKTKYVLTNFSDGTYENSPLHVSDLVPDYFHYYNNPNFFDRYKDSINLKKKNRLKLDRQSRLLKLKQIQYIVFINDIYAKKPSLVMRDKFIGGVLMSTANVYDLNSKELIGYTTITVKNSDEVKHQALADIRNIRRTILNRRLKEDLLKQRNKRIVNYFNIK
ncbi:hypothetical protein [Winogradskyella sp.]|jgi:hypothetical protein|uniref:hypothetical protein n=1 Tax=Winogradskyella sp. TaxID=1883156 RepID=UPI0025EA3F03|nr:hypothetical protein [Winogradskyella sp.]MCT4629411.1 hypothetical protein [Winogradskyella sp.]